jgi:metal-sulfur cluster biosynthetic enzyme
VITEAAVRRALDTVVDPCSVTAGAPAGLDSMGLLRTVTVAEVATGSRVVVRIALTDPTCLMGSPFVASSRDVLLALDGVTEVDVQLDDGHVWTEHDLSAGYRDRLARVRAARASAQSQS